MVSKNKIFYIISAIMLLGFISGVTIMGSLVNAEIVPIFGLPNGVHMILFMLIWPISGCILLVILFSYIFSRLYVKAKGLISPAFITGYIEIQNPEFSIKQFVQRALFCFLLSIGFFMILEGSGVLDLNLFLTEGSKQTAELQNIPVRYNINVFIVLILDFLPLAAAILSIGWALEDAGLIHYKLPSEESNKLFEIEPVNVRYNSYIKGYAGISSILFYISAVYYLVTQSNVTMDFMGILGLWVYFGLYFLVVVVLLPTYLLYLRIGKNFLRKNIPKRQKITQQNYENLQI